MFNRRSRRSFSWQLKSACTLKESARLDLVQTIAIEIQECHPSTHGFNKEAIRRLTAELLPVNACPLSNVSENLR